MCRNIKTLHNFEPPATGEEIQAACLQFVRKISGTTKPSKVNAEAFEGAVDEVCVVVNQLLASMSSNAPPKNREVEALRAKAKAMQRFAGDKPQIPQ